MSLTRTQRALIRVQKELAAYYHGKIHEFIKPSSFLHKEIQKQIAYFTKIKIRSIHDKQLKDAILAHSVIAVGDYHAFKPSQNEFYDLVRDYHMSGKPCVVVLESLLSESNADLKNFIAGHITATEFLEEADFCSYWEFPAYSTEKIMLFCKREGIPIFGMNITQKSIGRKGKNPNELFEERESHFVKMIHKIQSSHPQAKIFVLVGNLHLMPANLPKAYAKRTGKSLLCIHQNIDEIYWRRSVTLPPPSIFTGHRECFKVDDHTTVVLNSHPWIKYHSYWLQIEKGIEYEFLNKEDALEDMLMDQHEQFSHLFEKICTLLSVKLDVPDFAIYGPLDLSLPLLIKQSKKLTPREKLYYQARFKAEIAFYLPQEEVLFCPISSMNTMIDVITQAVVIHHRNWQHHFRGRVSDFYSWIVFEAHIFFISKLLNSSRKAPSFTRLFEGKSRNVFGPKFQDALSKILKHPPQGSWAAIEKVFATLTPDRQYQMVQWLGRTWGQAWFDHHVDMGNTKILSFFCADDPHHLTSAKRTLRMFLKQIPLPSGARH